MKRTNDINTVLADMDMAGIDDRTFAIGFFTKKGKYIYMPEAVKKNTNHNQKKYDYKGVQGIEEGEVTTHVYPVWIHAIKYYRSKTVKFEQ